MLIHRKLPPGHNYPQLTQFPDNYADFLTAFSGGQTVDNNAHLSTGNAVQTAMYKTALASRHLVTRANPIPDMHGGLLDIFLTDAGAEHIVIPQDRPFCQHAVELAQKSVAENDGGLHPHVGAVIVKDGKILSTGYRGETGEGRHAEFCALKKLNDDVDNIDLSGCTVYTTLEPCSERNPPKRSCTSRLIKANVARVVSGMPDKDKSVYGLSLLAEAGIHIGLFPSDLMQELLALNKAWSDTRRKPKVMPPANPTNAIASAQYYKPGTPMSESILLVVKPPRDDGGFYTIEDTARKVWACGRTIADIAVEWRAIYTQRVIVEKMRWSGGGSSNQLLNLP
jgi:pyrimidine deaminase RibD-like protein